jgi:hypothetical protein
MSITPPPGYIRAGEALVLLLQTPRAFWRSAFLAGDFNLHHPNWDPYYPSPSGQAELFVDWLDTFSFVFTSEVGCPT